LRTAKQAALPPNQNFNSFSVKISVKLAPEDTKVALTMVLR
jgi:hypothetical protein